MQAGYFYGSPGHDVPRLLTTLPDGRLLMAGSVLGADSTQEAALICIDTLGQVQWQRRLTGSHTQQMDGILVADTAIWVWGRSGAAHRLPKGSQPGFAFDTYVASYSLQGQPQYYHQLHSLTQDRLWAAQWAASGVLSMLLQADHDLHLVHLHLHTGQLDTIAMPQRMRGQVLRAACATSTGFLVALQDAQDTSQVLVARLAVSGQLVQLRQHTYTVPRPTPQCIAPTADGGYVLGGFRWAGRAGVQAWLLRTLRTGELAYERSWPQGGQARVLALQLLPDGGCVLLANTQLGGTHPQLKGMQDILLLRLDGSGHLLWQQTYGGPTNDHAVALAGPLAGSIWVLAQKENHYGSKPQSRGADYWLLRLRELPCTSQPLGIRLDADPAAVPRGRILHLSTNLLLPGQFYWDFGDGTHSTDARPTKTYDQAGDYRISLTLRLSETCLRVVTYPSVIRVVP